MAINTELRRSTLQDVARHAGVAKSTASAVLNGKEGKYAVSSGKRDAVLRAVKALEFEANPHAQRLVARRDTNTVGLFTTDLDAGVSMQKLRHIQHLLVIAGLNTPIYSAGESDVTQNAASVKLIGSLCLQRPAAIIVNARPDADLLPGLERFQAEGGILVVYDHEWDINCDHVVFDREHNTYEATAHLLRMGHRKVGLFIDGYFPAKQSPRFSGFLRAMREHEAQVREEWLLNSGTFFTKTIQEGGGELLAAKFLAMDDRPTALCVVNDASAAAFISTVQRAGVRVPEDVSVIGHDDFPISRIFPTRISTVSHPAEEIASHVVQLLLSRISGAYTGPPRRIDVRGRLIERDSVCTV